MAAILAAACCIALPAWADPAPAPRQPVARAGMEGAAAAKGNPLAQTATALAGEIDALRRQSISAAEAMQRHEAALSLLEAQLQSLGAAAAQQSASLQQDEAQRTGLLMALVALARHPPAALALAAPDPVSAERSALALGTAVPPLDRAAHRLHDELRQLASLREAIAAAHRRHRAEQQARQTEQQQLSDIAGRKNALERSTSPAAPDQQTLAALATEAASLQELAQRLDAAQQKVAQAALASGAAPRKSLPVPVAATAGPGRDVARPERLRRFADAAGHYLPPASGRVVASFGSHEGSGAASQGIAYETRAGAQVVAPYDGRVMFAGPFHAYGQILIIEHDGGYDSFVAGLDRLDVAVGQWVVAGEPVGAMPEGEEQPRLYLELRHDGQPVNPLPWLATSK